MAEQVISLWRPRRRWRWLLAGGALTVAAVLVVTVIGLPSWVRYADNGLPRVQGDALVQPITTAQGKFYGVHGRYASTLDELDGDEEAGFRRPRDLMLRVTGSPDGQAYWAGMVGFTGSYTAIIQTSGAAAATGTGDTLELALADAGWTGAWAEEHGFAGLADRVHTYGAVAVRRGELIELRESGGGWAVTVRPAPVTGTGATWQDAVVDAGVDPGLFTWPGTPAATPATVTADDDSATLTVALTVDGAVEVRVDQAGVTSPPAMDPADAVANAVLDEDVLRGLNESFVCATSWSANRVHSVTLCGDIGGRVAVYSSLGRTSANPLVPVALDRVGATAGWADKHGITLPTEDDLL